MTLGLNNFYVSYNNKLILQDINLAFQEKTVSAIVGPSGCGKTTLLRSINRTAELESGFRCNGEIMLYSVNIYQTKDVGSIRRRIGLVFQQPVALPMSITENVIFGVRYCGEKNKNCLQEINEQCLRRVALWNEVKDKLKRPARELSGGQLQRLSIARAIAVRPDVLLLDEPCSSLDPASTHMIEDLLVDLAQELTIIIVTHNLIQAKRIAQETVFMLDGQVVEKGPTEIMFSNPDKNETRDYFF
ncbi:MAG: phosphate ABC transporter ATP-binding protein [Syntrophomonas sp.]|nr:phosphate ABC transporter ATP-binding protein [Syntrophomonas sp.]